MSSKVNISSRKVNYFIDGLIRTKAMSLRETLARKVIYLRKLPIIRRGTSPLSSLLASLIEYAPNEVKDGK